MYFLGGVSTENKGKIMCVIVRLVCELIVCACVFVLSYVGGVLTELHHLNILSFLLARTIWGTYVGLGGTTGKREIKLSHMCKL